jgi:hypothetical protein
MPDAAYPSVIPPELAQARMDQALALIDFWVGVWSSNPQLARQAGRRVEEFMMTRDEVRRRHAHEWENDS